MLKIGIIVASVRKENNGSQVGQWIYDYATTEMKDKAEFELVHLSDYDLPFVGIDPSEAQGKAIKAWLDKMASFDGYTFVTPEYNRSVPGAFKNALEYLTQEVHNKAVGYVSYGGLGGLSSIQSLRITNAEQELASVRTMVTFSIMTDFENMSVFKPNDYHKENANKMFDQVLTWSSALKTIRG